jgi:hypothetical protein
MVLADTSIWVNHLRRADGQLAALLEADGIACHPLIIGELACGGIRNREEILSLLSALPSVAEATNQEALALIEKRGLMGRGIGFIDVHLLASCLLSGALLWTRDAVLARAASALGVAAGPASGR